MSGDWDYVNWYATRLHLLGEVKDENPRWPCMTAVCGADVKPTEYDKTRRANACQQAKDYTALPRCKRCARKAEQANARSVARALEVQ